MSNSHADSHEFNFLDDPHFQSLLVGCLESLQRGVAIDREAMAADYPQYAEEIGQFLDNRELLEDVASALDDVEPAPVATGAHERTMDSSSGGGDFHVGETIRYIGEYEVLEEIARGGMGVVFKARQARLGRIVALKMILAGRLANEQDVERFQLEARAAAGLKHPAIVSVHEVGSRDGQHYFTMDFIDGRSLADHLREESLAPRHAADIVRKLAEAIQFAHDNGVLHRDLKPANVLIDEAGEPHITDFGLAKLNEGDDSRNDLTASGQILGTPSYMSPEQAAGKRELVGPATDVYALGAVLYASVTGRGPLVAESPVDTLMMVMNQEPAPPRVLNPRVPIDLETICLKCLSKEPSKRYSTAQELADDLARFLSGRPVKARPVGAMSKGWRWCRRNPVVAALLCLVALTMAVGTGVSTYFAVEESRRATAERTARDDAVAARAESDRQARIAKTKRRAAEAAEERAEARRQEAVEARRLAEDRAEEIREQLYVAQMGQAQLAWEDDNIPRLLQLLDYHRPQPGQEDLRGFEWHYLWRLAHSERMTIDVGADAYDLACGPDGKVVATVDRANVTLWSADTGERIADLKHHGREEGRVAISPDGDYLAFARERVLVWRLDGEDRELIHDLKLDVPAEDLAFHPNAAQLAVASGTWGDGFNPRGEVRIIDVGSGETLATHQLPSIIRCVTYDHRGEHLAFADSDRGIHYWDAGLSQELTAFQGQVFTSGLAFSPDDATLVFGGNERYIQTIDLETGEWLRRWNHAGGVADLSFDFRGRHLVSATAAGKISVLHPEKSEVQQVFRGHTRRLCAAAPRPGMEEVVSLDEGGKVKFWPLHEKLGVRRMTGIEFIIADAEFNAAGNWLACAEGAEWNTDRQLAAQLFHAETGEPGPRLAGHDTNVMGVAFQADGRRLATVGDDGRIVVWDLENTAPVRVIETEERWFSVEMTADGKRLFAGSARGSVHVYDVKTGQETHTFQLHHRSVRSISLSPNGRYLAGCDGPGFKVWRISEDDEFGGEPLLAVKQYYTRTLTFSPDSATLVVGAARELQFYDCGQWRRTTTVKAHSEDVHGVAFSPDGRRVASCSRSGAIKLWDVDTRQSTIVLTSVSGDVNKKAPLPIFSPDGGSLLAGVRSQGVLLYSTKKPKPVVLRDARFWIHRAEQAARRQHWDKAVEHYESVLQVHPDHGWAALKAADCAFMTGDPAVYLKHAKAALQHLKKNADRNAVGLHGRLSRAVCLGPGVTDDYALPAEFASLTWAKTPESFIESMAMLFVQLRQGDYEKLLELTEQIRPGAGRAHRGTWLLFRAIALFELDRGEEASDAFSSGMTALDGDMPPLGPGRDIGSPHFDWLVAATAVHRTVTPLAEQRLNAALKKNPDNVGLLMHRGELHRRWRRWAAAADDFHRAAQLSPSVETLEQAAAAALMANNRKRHAELSRQLIALTKEAEHAGNVWKAVRLAAVAPQEIPDGESLWERLLPVVRRRAQQWHVAVAAPALLYRLGWYEEAKGVLQRMPDRDGRQWEDRSVTQLWRGLTQFQLGETEAARETLAEVDQRYEDHAQPPGFFKRVGSITPVEVRVLREELRRLLTQKTEGEPEDGDPAETELLPPLEQRVEQPPLERQRSP